MVAMVTLKSSRVQSFGGARRSSPLRLPSTEVQALRTVFGGLESEMGLASSMGAQIAAIAAAPKAKCGHVAASVVEWQDGDGVQQKRVRRERPCRRRAGPSTRDLLDVLEIDVPTEATAEAKADDTRARFDLCGFCRRRQLCPDCGECRHCGNRAWQTMYVPSASFRSHDPGTALPLEAKAFGVGIRAYRATRDALLHLVDQDGGTRHVVVLSRMYSGESSAEHSRRWPRLGDVVVLATLTEAVLARARSLTERVRREHRATSFQVSAFAALESAMVADNRNANADQIRGQAERMLIAASNAYLAAKRGAR